MTARCIISAMARRPSAGRIFRPKYHRGDDSIAESQVWWIGYYSGNGCKEHRESSKSTDWNDANRLLRRRLGEIAAGKPAGAGPERIHMAVLFDEFIRDYAANKRKSLYETKLRLDRHLRPFFSQLRAAEVTTARVRSYVESRQSAGASNATINRELAILRRGFQLALDAEQVGVHGQYDAGLAADIHRVGAAVALDVVSRARTGGADVDQVAAGAGVNRGGGVESGRHHRGLVDEEGVGVVGAVDEQAAG